MFFKKPESSLKQFEKLQKYNEKIKKILFVIRHLSTP